MIPTFELQVAMFIVKRLRERHAAHCYEHVGFDWSVNPAAGKPRQESDKLQTSASAPALPL